MKEITKEVLKDAANRLMFDLTDDELETLLKEFDVITKQMKTIGEVHDLDSYEPMTFPFDCANDVLREDEAETPLERDEAIKNAGSKLNGQIKLPKVVG